jgi:cytochrome c peroxidase
MKPSVMRTLAAAGLFGAALAAQTAAAPAADPAQTRPNIPALRAQAKDVLGILPDKMPGAEKDTRPLIDLGRKLYFEKRLSANQTQSCNSCHAIDENQAGVDHEPTSLGAFGKRGTRNSPTTLNAGFHFAQFWDGRAPNLEEQAKGPILNPVEMAMPNEQAVLERIGADKEYETLFAKAFPNAAEKITCNNLAQAIADFERTLITHDRLDDFLAGDDHALSTAQLNGLGLFLEAGCTTCHNGPLIGANAYQKVGLIHSYENTKDLGRFDVTKDESDKFRFKVPSLRNAALTSPYFHDGASARLEDAVKKMAWMQLGRTLQPDEIKSLAAFLESLSDKQRVRGVTQTAAAD